MNASAPRSGLPAWLPAVAYLLLAAPFAWTYRHHISSDAAVYLDLARLWAEGRFGEAVVGYWGPLLPILVALPVTFGVPLLLAGKAVAFAVGLAWVLACGALVGRVAGRDAGIRWATLGAVPATVVVGVPYSVLPDALLATAAAGLAGVLLAYARRPSPRKALAAGALCGVAYLCKSPAWILFLPPAVAAVAWCGGVLRRHRASGAVRRTVVHAALLVVAAAGCAAPWAAAVSLRTGTPTLGSASPFLLAHVYNRAGYPAPKSTRWVPFDGERWLLHNPWGMRLLGPVEFQPRFHAEEALRNVRRAVPFFAACPLALVGLLLGVLRTRRGLRSRRHAVLWFAAAWMTGSLAVRPMEARWLLYAAPVLLAAGVRFPMPAFLPGRRRARRALALAAVVVAGAAVVRWWPVRPLGLARAQGAATVRATLAGTERVWSNRIAAGLPVAFLLDRPVSSGSPFPGVRPGVPPPDVVVWSDDPGDARTRLDRAAIPDYAPVADWHEDGSAGPIVPPFRR